MRSTLKLLIAAFYFCLFGSQVILADQNYFVEQTSLEVPFRKQAHLVRDLLTRQDPISVAAFLGLQEITGQSVSISQNLPKEPSCSDCDEKSKITIAGVGRSVKLPSKKQVQGTLFVRDPKVLSWNHSKKELESKSLGNSEVYIVSDNKMTIVKVEVKDENEDLKQPDTSIKSILNRSNQTYSQLSLPYESKVVSPSLRSSVEALNEVETKVKRKVQKGQYKSIAIQLVDERSIPEDNKIYPLSGISVSLPASDFVQTTNARGIVEISDVPAGGRFLVRVKDEDGRVLDQTVELATEPDSQSELFRIRTLSYRSYFLYSSVFDVTQRTDLSSLCFRAMSADGLIPLAGVSAEINVEADGPFYFSDFGPNGNESESSENGRVCFFNVKPGLTEVSFFEKGEYLSSVAIPLVPGHHLEDDIFLANGRSLSTQLVALPSASQTVYGDFAQQNEYFDVDYTEMIAVGENEPLVYEAPGRLKVESGQTFYRGRLFGLVQGAEFETALYSFDPITGGGANPYRDVSPLLQRGFVEDLFNELYLSDNSLDIAFDPALGSVFVRHGRQVGENLDDLKIRLVNHLGQDVQDPWFVGSTETGFIQAIFFNLRPGVYTLVVESGRNHWIDATTVPVDYWLTTVLQTGAPLESDTSLE